MLSFLSCNCEFAIFGLLWIFDFLDFVFLILSNIGFGLMLFFRVFDFRFAFCALLVDNDLLFEQIIIVVGVK